MFKSIPLNQILYGPPGTGKTYHTIDKAKENSQEVKYKIENGVFKEFFDKALVAKQNFNFNQIKDDFLDHCREKSQ